MCDENEDCGSCASDCGECQDYTVIFDLDGLDNCGFVSVTGTFDGWTGFGANTDTGMAATMPAGSYEFVVLCVEQGTIDAGVEWWNDIWANATIINAPIEGGDCWNGNYDYPNYVFNVSEDMTVSYCAGTCDAECSTGPYCGDGVCDENEDCGSCASDCGECQDYTVIFDFDGLDNCGFVSVTGTFDGWSGWGANTDTYMTTTMPAGSYEFVVLCVEQGTIDAGVEWWNDIWANATIVNAPIDGGDCWNGKL